MTLATNGLKAFPRARYEQVALLVALFGGARLDDELRAIKPGGKKFTGLFEQALANYRNDPRAFFLYAITEDGVDQVEDTVKLVADNGNRLHFSYYSKYDTRDPLKSKTRSGCSTRRYGPGSRTPTWSRVTPAIWRR